MMLSERRLRGMIWGRLVGLLREGAPDVRSDKFAAQIVTTGVMEAFYLFLTEGEFAKFRLGIWKRVKVIELAVTIIEKGLVAQNESELIGAAKALAEMMIAAVPENEESLMLLECDVFKRLLMVSDVVVQGFKKDLPDIIKKGAYLKSGECAILVNHLKETQYSGWDTMGVSVNTYSNSMKGVKKKMLEILRTYCQGVVPEVSNGEVIIKNIKKLLPVISGETLILPDTVKFNVKKQDKKEKLKDKQSDLTVSDATEKEEKDEETSGAVKKISSVSQSAAAKSQVSSSARRGVSQSSLNDNEVEEEGSLFKIPKLPRGYYDLYRILVKDQEMAAEGRLENVQSLRKFYQDKFMIVGDKIDLSDLTDDSVKIPKLLTWKNGKEDVFQKRPTVDVAMKKIKAQKKV
jgi:hypothetical protein